MCKPENIWTAEISVFICNSKTEKKVRRVSVLTELHRPLSLVRALHKAAVGAKFMMDLLQERLVGSLGKMGAWRVRSVLCEGVECEC